jgi:hypothetical protein
MARRKHRTTPPARRHGPDDEAARIGTSTTLTLEACREGRYPHTRLGRRILIDPVEADAFLAATGTPLEAAITRARELDS